MDIKHYYIEKGEGTTLILLHGNGGSSEEYRSQIDEWAPYFHVYALDTRGHGKTPRGTKPFTIRQFAEDLYGFMERQHIEKADIIGFSDGGNIALAFALKYPKKVRHLVLNGANLDPKGVKAYFQLPITAGYRLTKLSHSPAAKGKREMLGLMVNDPYFSDAALTRLKPDTMVVAGTNDLIYRKHTERIARNIPRCVLLFVKGHHSASNTSPKKNKLILDFLQH